MNSEHKRKEISSVYVTASLISLYIFHLIRCSIGKFYFIGYECGSVLPCLGEMQ